MYQNNRKKCRCVIETCKDIGLAVNTGKIKYMEIGRHRGAISSENIKIDSNSYGK